MNHAHSAAHYGMNGAAHSAASRGALLLATLLCALALLAGCGRDRSPEGNADGISLAERGQLTRSVLCYFATADGETMEPERRELVLDEGSRETMAKLLIAELARGPHREDLYATVPPTIEIDALFFDDVGGMFVSFVGASLLPWSWGSSSEFLMVRSTVRSLGAAFPSVRRITFLVDGRRADSLAGHVGTAHPFEVAEWR